MGIKSSNWRAQVRQLLEEANRSEHGFYDLLTQWETLLIGLFKDGRFEDCSELLIESLNSRDESGEERLTQILCIYLLMVDNSLRNRTYYPQLLTIFRSLVATMQSETQVRTELKDRIEEMELIWEEEEQMLSSLPNEYRQPRLG